MILQIRPSTLISSLCRCYGTIPWIYTHFALGPFLKWKKKMFFNPKFITTNSSHLQSFKFRQNLVWGSNKYSIFSSPWTENHEGYDYKVVAVKRNADAKFTPVCGLAISETLFFLSLFLTAHDNRPPFCLCFLGSVAPFLPRANFTKPKSAATTCEGVQNRKEGSSGWKVRFISVQRRRLLPHLYCSSPINLSFLQTLQSPFFPPSLITVFSLSFHFSVCTVLPELFSGKRRK